MSADFWAGYVSGAAGIVIGNPLDLIKVRLQAAPPAIAAAQPNTAAAAAAAAASPTARPSAAHIHTLRDALRGLPAPVLTYGALNALLFTTYNRSLFLLARPDPAASIYSYDPAASAPAAAAYPYWAHFAAGALAGLATFVISAPTELIKCRAQVLSDSGAGAAPAARSSWHIAAATLRAQGLPGLYVGGAVTSLRDALGYGAYFVTYEAAKDAWPGGGGGGDGGGGEAAKILACGGLAGIATWASIFPLDVVKTRVQTQAMLVAVPDAAVERSALLPVRERLGVTRSSTAGTVQSGTGLVTARQLGTWTVVRQAYSTEGWRVFFRGLTVCCVRAFIVNAAQWAVYEWMMSELKG